MARSVTEKPVRISFTLRPGFERLVNYARVVEISGSPGDVPPKGIEKSYLFHLERDEEGNTINLLDEIKIYDIFYNLGGKLYGEHGGYYLGFTRPAPNIISLPLRFSAEKLMKTGKDDHHYAISEVYSEAELLGKVFDTVDLLRDYALYLNIPIALENLGYHQGGAYDQVCDPKFIEKVVNRHKSGIFLLLDIPNAIISAHNLGFGSVEEYLKELPLDKVIEIHLSSPDKSLRNTHLPATKKEIDLIESLRGEMPNLEVINLDYDSGLVKLERLKEDLIALREIFEKGLWP